MKSVMTENAVNKVTVASKSGVKASWTKLTKAGTVICDTNPWASS